MSPGKDDSYADRMKRDWDERAAENARYYIATDAWEDPEAFWASGLADVAHLFEGLEDLLHEGATAVDLGCGIGRMGRHVAPRVARWVGVDVSPVMLAKGREALADLANADFVETDGFTLAGLGDASVDLVYSLVTFQHLGPSVVAAYVAEARRVLRPGGSLLFQVPGKGEGTPENPPDEETFQTRFFDERETVTALEAAGFARVEVTPWRIAGTPDWFRHYRFRAIAPT
ncbi:MAG: class I SAM-dependent methyltransferase [Planctomycetota bacterium]